MVDTSHAPASSFAAPPPQALKHLATWLKESFIVRQMKFPEQGRIFSQIRVGYLASFFDGGVFHFLRSVYGVWTAVNTDEMDHGEWVQEISMYSA